MLTLKQKLFAHRRIDSITGCWLWTGYLNRGGYGQITHENKVQRIHRLAYEEFVGPIEYLILHKKECPNKHCFNPEHLYDGNHSDNMQDAYATVRQGSNTANSSKTHCPKGHEYTNENTFMKGNSRNCRKCISIRGQERYQKLKQIRAI